MKIVAITRKLHQVAVAIHMFGIRFEANAEKYVAASANRIATVADSAVQLAQEFATVAHDNAAKVEQDLAVKIAALEAEAVSIGAVLAA